MAANSGKECLNILSKEIPDLILLDVMVPGITGIEVARKIRATQKMKNLKIIFLTVVRQKEIRQDILKEINAVDYLTKPFDNAELANAI